MMRILNIVLIAVLVAAAAHVYKIKFEATREAERLAKLRTEIRREQDAIASLRAEWSKLETPARIQELANRHLALRPIDPRQFDTLRQLPERPAGIVPPDAADPIGSLLENPDMSDVPTSSIPTASQAKR